jgi:hypothetical protein
MGADAEHCSALEGDAQFHCAPARHTHDESRARCTSSILPDGTEPGKQPSSSRVGSLHHKEGPGHPNSRLAYRVAQSSVTVRFHSPVSR